MRQLIKNSVYRYIESKHGFLQKKALYVLCYVLFRLLSVPKSVINDISAEINDDDFKLVFRRALWLLNGSVWGRRFTDDRYFDFSLGLSHEASLDMYSYVNTNLSCSLFDSEIYAAQFASAALESKVSIGEVLNIDTLPTKELDELFLYHLATATCYIKIGSDFVKQETEVELDLERLVTPASLSNKGQSSKFRKDALEAYFELLDLFDELNISIFAISGTMLGMVREGDFLEHDNDIDLGVIDEGLGFSKVIKAINQSDSFFIKKIDYPCYRGKGKDGPNYTRLASPSLLKIGHRTGVHTDLFVHIKIGDKYWHGSSLHGWLNSRFDLEKINFKGRVVFIPKTYDLYLTENYGDWKTPVSKFRCSTDTPNIDITNSCKTLCYFVKMAYDYQESGMYRQKSLIISKMINSGHFRKNVHTSNIMFEPFSEDCENKHSFLGL